MVSDLIIIVVVVRILWLLPAISTSSHTGECVYKWSSKWKNSPSKLLKLNSKRRLYQWLMQSVFMKIHKKSIHHIKLVSLIKNQGSIIEINKDQPDLHLYLHLQFEWAAWLRWTKFNLRRQQPFRQQGRFSSAPQQHPVVKMHLWLISIFSLFLW